MIFFCGSGRTDRPIDQQVKTQRFEGFYDRQLICMHARLPRTGQVRQIRPLQICSIFLIPVLYLETFDRTCLIALPSFIWPDNFLTQILNLGFFC